MPATDNHTYGHTGADIQSRKQSHDQRQGASHGQSHGQPGGHKRNLHVARKDFESDKSVSIGGMRKGLQTMKDGGKAAFVAKKMASVQEAGFLDAADDADELKADLEKTRKAMEMAKKG